MEITGAWLAAGTALCPHLCTLRGPRRDERSYTADRGAAECCKSYVSGVHLGRSSLGDVVVKLL